MTPGTLPARQLDAPQLDALTGIRGVAAWMVVIFHLRTTLIGRLPGWAMALAGRGYLAVDLFFILSGFVLWLSYGARLSAGGREEVWRFWWRRFARIWPLHLVILALWVMLAGLLAITGRSTAGMPFAELPFHMLLIQNWGFVPRLDWNVPAWSISCEMGAYLVFPFAARWLRPARLPTLALIALVPGLIGGEALYYAAHGFVRLSSAIPVMGVGRCLFAFALGVVLCLLWQRWRETPGVADRLTLIALPALGLSGWLGLPETALAPATFATLILVLALGNGALSGGLIPGCHEHDSWQPGIARAAPEHTQAADRSRSLQLGISRILASPVVCYLGTISYATYLSHYLALLVFKLVFVTAVVPGAPLMRWGQVTGFLALVLAGSIILHHGIEKPAQAWLNRHPPRFMITRRRARPAPAPPLPASPPPSA